MPQPLTPSYRWIPPTQRRFLGALAQTQTIKRARSRFDVAAGGLCVSAAQGRAGEYTDSVSTS